MRRPGAWLLLGSLLAGSPAGAADWAGLVERYAPAIVNLKISVKAEAEGGGEPEESTQEVEGALVDPGGLILVWNSHFSANRFLDLMSGMGGGDFRMKVTPTDIKVYLDGDPTEHKAFLAAADSDLDLAFVQLESPPDRPLPAIDFARPGKVAIGDEVAVVARLTSTFDRVPYFDVVRVSGEIRKPRRAWIVAGGNATRLGMPYFAADGGAAGVLVTVVSSARSDALTSSSSWMASLLSIGRGEVEVGPIGVFLLPADRIAPVIEQARLRVRELRERRQNGAPPAVEPPAPAAAEPAPGDG